VVSALRSLYCFDTDGWVTGRTSRCKRTHFTGSFLWEQMEEEYTRGNQVILCQVDLEKRPVNGTNHIKKHGFCTIFLLLQPKTTSTGTLHTSAKARLTSIAIHIWIRDPDRHQNLVIYLLTHCQPSLKIS